MQKQQGYLNNDIAEQLIRMKALYLTINRCLYRVGCHRSLSTEDAQVIKYLIRTTRPFLQLEKDLDMEFKHIKTAPGTIFTNASHESIIATSQGILVDLRHMYENSDMLHSVYTNLRYTLPLTHYVLQHLDHLSQLIEEEVPRLLKESTIEDFLEGVLNT